MAIQTFELVSPFMSVYAPSKKWLGSSDLLRGQTSNRLVAGELLELSGTGVNRPTFAIEASKDKTDNAFGFAKCAFPYFSETGRGDIITSGSIPVLQHGPFEADTMCFMREGDEGTNANGEGLGSLAAGPDEKFAVGELVFAAAVRNPNTGVLSSSDYVVGIAPADSISNAAYPIGRVSRIIGSGATAKIRVIFGIN